MPVLRLVWLAAKCIMKLPGSRVDTPQAPLSLFKCSGCYEDAGMMHWLLGRGHVRGAGVCRC